MKFCINEYAMGNVLIFLNAIPLQEVGSKHIHFFIIYGLSHILVKEKGVNSTWSKIENYFPRDISTQLFNLYLMKKMIEHMCESECNRRSQHLNLSFRFYYIHYAKCHISSRRRRSWLTTHPLFIIYGLSQLHGKDNGVNTS